MPLQLPVDLSDPAKNRLNGMVGARDLISAWPCCFVSKCIRTPESYISIRNSTDRDTLRIQEECLLGIAPNQLERM